MRKNFERRTILAASAAGALILAVTLAIWLAPSPGVTAPESEPEAEAPPAAAPVFHYIEIIGGCDSAYAGAPCVNVRPSPGVAGPSVMKLREGLVLQVAAETVPDEDPAAGGRRWHKIIFDGTVRYPERISGDWYVVADPSAARAFEDPGVLDAAIGATTTSAKRILVDLSDERLYAYDGGELFMEEPISSGLEETPTPRGNFSVFRKTPSRYMQGPLPGISDQKYDLPGVPWNLYFTEQGAVVHGAYWHNGFGSPWSHGCVNLAPDAARELYLWAELGVPVTVRD